MTTGEAELAQLVSRVFAGSPSPLHPGQAAVLADYLRLLLKWSKRINLTGFRNPATAAAGLLYDATEVAPMVPTGAMVLDVGAGAGGLGVALAVLRPDVSLRLVEPRTKRAVFLRTVRRALELTDRLEVLEARAEELGPEVTSSADVAYAQAVMPVERWLPLGLTLVRPDGGFVLALTATELSPTQVPPELVVGEARAYHLPDSGAARVVTRLERAAVKAR